MMKLQAWCAALAGAAIGAGAWGQCQEGWSEAFTPAAFDGPIEALSVFDDGSGPMLVALGDFTVAGGLPREHLAVWAGSTWEVFPTPDWQPGYPEIMRSDPSRTRLCVVRLDDILYIREGGEWREIPLPVRIGSPHDFEFGPNGAEDVYIAGRYWLDSGDFTPVLRWDGQAWSHLGSDVGSSVEDIAWFDDGAGPRLFAAGSESIDGVDVHGLAVWNGAAWEAVAPGRGSEPRKLAVWDDGAGEAIFTTDGRTIGRWDGQTWTEFAIEPAASGMGGFQSVELGGSSMLIWSSDLESGAGRTRLWRWDGVDGEPLAGAVEGRVLAVEPAGPLTPGVFVGGDFVSAGGSGASNVASFDGTAWTDVSSAQSGNGAPEAGVVVSIGNEAADGLGGRVYVADASFAGGRYVRTLASWRDGEWSRVAPESFEEFGVRSLLVGDLGAGPRLFAAGTVAEDRFERGVAAWDGQSWTMLPPAYTSSSILTMAVGEVGGTRQLLIGGAFERLGADQANHVGSFDGTTWRTLGAGVDDWVWSSAAFDDGAGEALYVGGQFTEAGGMPASAVARWDGEEWSAVGEGFTWVDGSFTARVYAMQVADLGDGPRLYAGGQFDASGSVALSNIAVWNGSGWEAVGSGLPGAVLGLGVIDLGEGPRLTATGDGVHMWDGSSWTAFAEANGPVRSITQASHEEGALYLVGGFTEVAGMPSEGIARWGCEACAADFNGDGTVDTRDFVAFLDAWAAGHDTADFDGNGTVDTRDFVGFLNAWTEGC